MTEYKAGDKSKAICWCCKQLRDTTFQYRDLPMRNDPDTLIPVLAAVCDTCNSVVGIPQQISEQIREFMRNK